MAIDVKLGARPMELRLEAHYVSAEAVMLIVFRVKYDELCKNSDEFGGQGFREKTQDAKQVLAGELLLNALL